MRCACGAMFKVRKTSEYGKRWSSPMFWFHAMPYEMPYQNEIKSTPIYELRRGRCVCVCFEFSRSNEHEKWEGRTNGAHSFCQPEILLISSFAVTFSFLSVLFDWKSNSSCITKLLCIQINTHIQADKLMFLLLPLLYMNSQFS